MTTLAKQIEEWLYDVLGEGFHTAFRKATDSAEGTAIWQAINDMDEQEWEDVLKFVIEPTAEYLASQLLDSKLEVLGR